MKWWLYALLIIATLGVAGAFTLKAGWDPAPVGIMKPSFFDRPEEIGVVAFRRFYAPIEQYKLTVIGVPPHPEWQKQIVRGMLNAAAASPIPYDVLLADPEMPELDVTGVPNLTVEKMSINSATQADFIQRIRELKAANKRVLVYTASVLSTHTLKGNPVERYERTTGERLFTISTGPLSLQPSQEFLINPPCVGTERDANGTANLGCITLRASRGYYRKKLDQTRFVGVMIAPSPEDYLLLVSAPGQNKIDAPEPTPPPAAKPGF